VVVTPSQTSGRHKFKGFALIVDRKRQMKKRINEKIKLLWNEIREHLRDKRKSNPKDYWYKMHVSLFEQKCFAIKVLKEIK